MECNQYKEHFIKNTLRSYVTDKTNFCLKSRNLSFMVRNPGSASEEHNFNYKSIFIRIH